MYRKFLIFPRENKVILKRKAENEIQTAFIGFDFEEMNFYAEQKGNNVQVETFNEFLITGRRKYFFVHPYILI